MKNGITRESFTMEHLRILKGGGIESVAQITATIDGSFMEIERKQKTPIVPHPALENAVRELKEKLLVSTGFMDMRTLVESKEFNATANQKDAVAKAIDLIKSKTTVTGVHVSGEDKTRGVIISGKITSANGSAIAVNSPRMRFTSSVFGFEEDLESEIANIETELFAYLHEGKKAQLEIMNE